MRILPDRTTIKLLRAFRQQAPGGRAKSTRMLEEVISVFPHPTYFGILAEFYCKEDRDQDLIRLVRQLDQAIARTEVQAAAAPGSGKTHLDLGALYLRRGRVGEARNSLLKARELYLHKDQRAAVEELLQVIEDLEQNRAGE